MDRVFSMGEIDDHFWSINNPPIGLHDEGDAAEPPSPSSSGASSSKMIGMNRSSSEWAFQQFLQEAAAPDHTASTLATSSTSSSRQNNDVVNIKGNFDGALSLQRPGEVAAEGPPAANIPTDPEKYQALLKSRLELACAAVALTRGSNAKTQEAAVVALDSISQASSTSKPGSHVTYKASGPDLSKHQDKDTGGPVGIPPLPTTSKKIVTQVKSATSGSSGEQSDDDDAEGDSETMQNGGPTDAKRMRRMLSNRESARRSRRRKQAHLSELEGQVSQLSVENSSLVKRLTDISQKYNEAAVDNRVLKADVETLRAKVKMAEETVKRVTGLNPLFQVMSEISTMNMPSFSGSPDTSADIAVPVQNDPNQQQFYLGPSNVHAHAQNHIVQNGTTGITPVENVQPNDASAAVGVNKMGRTVSSMQRVDSLEHLQNRIRGGASSGGTDGAGER